MVSRLQVAGFSEICTNFKQGLKGKGFIKKTNIKRITKVVILSFAFFFQ